MPAKAGTSASLFRGTGLRRHDGRAFKIPKPLSTLKGAFLHQPNPTIPIPNPNHTTPPPSPSQPNLHESHQTTRPVPLCLPYLYRATGRYPHSNDGLQILLFLSGEKPPVRYLYALQRWRRLQPRKVYLQGLRNRNG